jgi:hypothetical protein
MLSLSQTETSGRPFSQTDQLVIVAVMMRMRRDHFHGHHAAVYHWTLHVLKLNRCVMDVKIPQQAAIDLFQNARAL